MSQQAAEKALKAAGFSLDSDQQMTHDLRSLANYLDGCSENLHDAAYALSALLGDGIGSRYPDRMTSPRIPHDVHGQEKACKSQELARLVITEAKAYIHRTREA